MNNHRVYIPDWCNTSMVRQPNEKKLIGDVSGSEDEEERFEGFDYQLPCIHI